MIYNAEEFHQNSDAIRSCLKTILNKISVEIDIEISYKSFINDFKNFVIYDILDGSRSTLTSKKGIDRNFEGFLYAIEFIHALKSIGAKYCVFMIHTSYNRERGASEFKRILNIISSGITLLNQYAVKNNVKCTWIGMKNNYELIDLINENRALTENGKFNAFFLVDYSEKWATTPEGLYNLSKLPNIDVHVRHTKFQPSGGWIPEKMAKSVFVYSQNGTIYSNWKIDELIALISISWIAKKLHEGELLSKTYGEGEKIERYEHREIELFSKTVYLNKNSKKLFVIGSPIGLYHFYY